MPEPNPARKAFQEAVEKRDTKVVKLKNHKLGIDVYCRLLRAKAHSELGARYNDPASKAKQNFVAEYLALCLCDETGALMFPGEFGAVDLGEMPASELGPIFKECQEINGISDDALKNSAPTGAGGS